MAFRKQMFEKYGGFRTDLGRCGKELVGSEDTEFGERLMAAGEHLWYVPSAVVNHSVHQDRLTKEYFQAWFFSCGQAESSTARVASRKVGDATILSQRRRCWG